MRIKDYQQLMDFYLKYKTLKVSDEHTIMEIFNYFVNRDMSLVASLMLNSDEQVIEITLIQVEEEEKQIDMETDVPILVDLDFDIPSEAELF